MGRKMNMHSNLAHRLSPYLAIWCVAAMLALTAIAYPVLQRDLWTDEAFSASYTQHSSVGALLDDVRKNEETPPGYFLALWLWSRLAGQGELALRAFSLLCGLVAAGLFAELARRWLAPAAAAVAAAVFALSPVLARYLVEVRGYTLLLLLALLCIVAFERLYREPTRTAALAAYTLAAAALFLTTYFGAALILAHNLIWLAMLLRRPDGWPRRLIGWCAAQIGIALLIAPWLPSLLYQIKVAPAVSPFEGAQPIHYLLLLLMMPMHTAPGTAWSGLWLLLALAGWALLAIGAWRAEGAERGLLLRTLGVPALTLLGLILWMQAVGPRYLMTLLPGVALAIGLGGAALWRRAPRLAAPALYAGLAALLVYRLSGASAPAADRPWSALVPQLAAQVDPASDVVLLHPPYEQRTFAYYYRGPALQLAGANDYDDFYYAQGHVLRTAWSLADAVQAARGGRRIWVFYNPLLGAPRLDLPYRQAGHWSAGALELALYEVQAQSK